MRAARVAGAALSCALALSACATTPPDPPTTTASAGDLRVTVNPAQPFAVRIAPMAKQPMVEGESMSFRLESQRSGYAQLYLLQASGSVLVLAENLAVRSRDERVFPGPVDGFDLRVRPPAGVDNALLVVTAQPFPAILGPAAAAAKPGPVLAPLPRDAFVDRLGTALARLHPDAWNSAMTSTEVLVRK
ncbi:hypothetical protein J2847_003331 [Azospirillum agricola]|uniref:DUF4384 domain-containing protein n=1 Tax=Azospirillum agricola TaxID=1720247 RepID=UPI001AE11F3F|nr:DUF4384 domain-containing protein [Azospirillum agricola]MBP2230028.1 hypothetical protein [Azospirillum agricola]